MKVLSRGRRIWNLKGDLIHKPLERNIMFIHQRKRKGFAQNQRFGKGKASFSSLTGDGLYRSLLESCVCLIPQDSLCEHCVWLSIAQQAPPPWPAPDQHTAHFWVNGEHIFSSMRNNMCHKASGSWGVGSSMMSVHGVAHRRMCPPFYPPKKQ